jgi:ABC-type antimicrobial peptide transport system permease subunit
MLLVRTAVPPSQISRTIEAAISVLLPAGSQPPRMEIVDDQFRRITGDRRFNAGIMSAFGLLALVIGVVGIYGVTASIVAQQTREIGVRMALGATSARVVWSIAADTGRLLAVGAAIGLAAAWATSSVFRSLIFGLEPTDIVVYVVPFAVLVVAGGLAAIVPALRASRVDPLVALRQM